MTPTQMARRSDALYADGTCGMTRRVLCDMVAQREADLEDARAENAKLRDLLKRTWDAFHDVRAELSTTQLNCDLWHDRAEDMRNRLSETQAENAKLRELVRDYERCTMHADCAGCEYDGNLSTHCPLSPCFPDADELCELGVEVDDGY